MMQNFINNISLSKISPPSIDQTSFLNRKRHFDNLNQNGVRRKKALLIQAQAGQGKSTFAAQLLDYLCVDFSWYQLGLEDEDPVFLLSAILAAIQIELPKFHPRVLENQLTHGVVGTSEVPSCTELLLGELNRSLTKDFFLVLDDVYLLSHSPVSLALLSQLLGSKVDKFHLLLISRSPIMSLLNINLPVEEVLVIGNEDLALSQCEIAELFNDVLQRPVTISTVHSLSNATEGWMTGLLLLANTESMITGPERLKPFQAENKDAVFDYFIAKILSQLPNELQRTLDKLSLLSEIPILLAEKLAEGREIQSTLEDMESRNLFIRKTDKENPTYVFHHLFQDCLRRNLETKYHPSEIRDLFYQIAIWYRDNGQNEAALIFFLQGRNYDEAQLVLKQVGMTLHAEGRIVTLQSALACIPAEKLSEYPWLAYYHAVTLINTDPPATLPWLKIARSGFTRTGDDLGELLTLILTIYFHAAVDTGYNQGLLILDRADHLFNGMFNRLAPQHQTHAANLLLIGHAIFNAELEKGRRYVNLGVAHAKNLGHENLMAEAYMARCYFHLFAADLRSCRLDVESSWQLLQSPNVNSINKGALQVAFLNMLTLEQDLSAYRRQKAFLNKLLGEEVVYRSIFGAIIRVWDIDWEFSRGHWEEAGQIIQFALDADFTGAGPHLRSQYLQYHALLLAKEGKTDSAVRAAEESLALRNLVGGRFFEAVNAAMIGGVYALLGKPEQAQDLWTQGLEKSQAIGEFHVRAAILAQRATLSLTMNDLETADKDISSLLAILRHNQYVRFWGWSPEMMQRLMVKAVQSGIESNFARDLALQQLDCAILDDGAIIPLLQVHTLGRFEIIYRNCKILRASDFSDTQRKLLASLLVAPDCQMHQEEIQTVLWPDSSPTKSRSSFDNLLSRLRKVFETALNGFPVKNYLKLQNGILRLDNCRIDFKIFEEKSLAAIAHVRKKECWQADNAFASAFQLWQGTFMSSVPLCENAEIKRCNLSLLYLENALKWCNILIQKGEESEAIMVADQALYLHPTNDTLVRVLYNLHAQSGDRLQTRKTLDRYIDALRQDGFSSKECERFLDAFWSLPV